MRRFYLNRKEDVSGMSSTGRVADGIEFDNGFVAMTWKKEFPSVTFFQSISTVEKLHSHNGRDETKIVWVDPIGENIEAKSEKLKTAKLKELQQEADEAAAEAAAEAAVEEIDIESEQPKTITLPKGGDFDI